MTRALRNEDVFQAIAHPVRRKILIRLAEGEKGATDLASPFKISLPAVSQQLNVLKQAGLVSERRVGRQRLYQLHPKPLREVFEWVEFFENYWIDKLDALGEHLRKKHGEPKE
jgi:DNA-binding transcriptional ArsR family regulator